MAAAKTPLPEPAQLAEFATVAAENAHRLIGDAETLIAHDSWPTAYSLAVLAFEEIGKSWLCLIGVATPASLRNEYPFADMVGSHLHKLQAARTIAPLLAFITNGPDEAVAGFISAVDAIDELAREDNLAKQRGIYADYRGGVIWNPAGIGCDEATGMVAGVREVINRSAPLTCSGFAQFAVSPPPAAREQLDAFMRSFLATLEDGGPEAAIAVLAEMRSLMPGAGEAFERDVQRLALDRSGGTAISPDGCAT